MARSAGEVRPRGFIIIGTKRPYFEAGYYQACNRENVTLVDLCRTPLARFTPGEMRTAGME